MMRYSKRSMLLGLALAGLLLGGCNANERLAVGPLTGPFGDRRSLALDSPQMRRLPARADGTPWYAVRNDVPRSVSLGEASRTEQYSQTYTYDQLGTSHDDVYDHYRRTTYRESFRRTSH